MSENIKYIAARPADNLDSNQIATLSRAGTGTPLIYFAGFGATMEGNKAQAIARFADDENVPLIRFDYQGVGASSSDGTEGTLSLWADDALSVLDQLVDQDAIIIGSSMGAWIALLTALRRPEKIRSLILIACAADFTEPMRSQKNSGPATFPRSFIEDGSKHLMLSETIEITQPVTLIHGKLDETIPWQNSVRTATALASNDVTVHIRRDGDHRLSSRSDIEFMFEVIKRHQKA